MFRRLTALVLLLMPVPSPGQEAQRGSLLIVGGGERPDNAALLERFIQAAGGKENARIGILPTASVDDASARRKAGVLARYGMPAAQIEVIDIPRNDRAKAKDPAVAARIRRCTGLYFVGGDQTRITGAFHEEDGSDTLALESVRDVLSRGGVVAGTSAGAAAMGRTMITVSGLPDEVQDYGMDSLDFGKSAAIARRGVFLSPGLGLFGAGPIDQHFDGLRGRFARLARVLVEQRVATGYGVDENTAMLVRPDGAVEVVGAGGMTIVDASGATSKDGPRGFRMTGVRLTYLTGGDSYDPGTGRVTIHPDKREIERGREEWVGNELITDISGIGALRRALTVGLIDSTSASQAGIDLRYNGRYGHGYKFTFSKADETRGYRGFVDGIFAYSVCGVRMDAEPTTATLEPPDAHMPVDLPPGAPGEEVEALVFRGIMLVDGMGRFRPGDPVTRAELANALAGSTIMKPKRGEAEPLHDVGPATPFAGDIARVVATGLMDAERGRFRPHEHVTRGQAAVALVRVAKTLTTAPLPGGPLDLVDVDRVGPAEERGAIGAAVRADYLDVREGRFRPDDPVTRVELATALYRVLGFPW